MKRWKRSQVMRERWLRRLMACIRQRMRDGNPQNYDVGKRFNAKDVARNQPMIESHRRNQR
jgi:hypothetical protein